MIRPLAVLGAIWLAVPAAGAQTPPASPTREARVDAIYEKYDRSDSPGCTIGVFQNGRIVYARGYGMANLELKIANSPQTVFDIGSLGKQFTAFSIHLLARDGKLSLDDDIRKHLPELPAFGAPVTIRHLLHHTGGLRDYLELMMLAGARTEDLTTEQEALAVQSRQKAPLFPPGTEFLYSNTGYFLLGVIVKRASGKSLRDFARERIFEPLGMTHSQFNEDHSRVIPNRATGYSPSKDGGFGIDMSDFEQNGDGGMLTSLEDIFRWDQNFNEPRVGDRALLSELESPGSLKDGKRLNYASGLRVGTYRGLRTVGHTGSWAGYLAQLTRFPDQKFSVASLCNRTGVDRIALMQRVAEVYLGDRMEKETSTGRKTSAAKRPVASARLERLVGAYRDPKSGAVWFLSIRDGALVVDAQGERIELVVLAADRFAEKEGGREFRFEPAEGERRPRLRAVTEDEAPRVFEPLEVWAPSPSQVPGFTGSYFSDELQSVFRFEAEKGTLLLRHRTFPADPWTPTLPDSFVREDLAVTFTRGPAGEVTGLTLDAGRLRGLAFRKIAS